MPITTSLISKLHAIREELFWQEDTCGIDISAKAELDALITELACENGTTPGGPPPAFADASGHTPGPWQQDWQFIVAPDPAGIHHDIYIAEMAEEDSDGRVASPEQQAANGRLIAAAPELLAACRMVVGRWEKGDLAEAARACHAAAALATDGRPPWDIRGTTLAVGKPYSVLLLYPDHANDFGTETYYAWVEAADPLEAVAAARRKATSANECIRIEPEDFAPLLVVEGHHYGQPLFNK